MTFGRGRGGEKEERRELLFARIVHDVDDGGQLNNGINFATPETIPGVIFQIPK